MDPKFLNLTKVDDQIYSEFRKSFKDLKIDVLDPEELKSESAKEVGGEQGGGTHTTIPPLPGLQGYPCFFLPRNGARSACGLRGWWRTSTTAPCSAWTAAKTTPRRTPSSVSEGRHGTAGLGKLQRRPESAPSQLEKGYMRLQEG